MHRHHKHSRLSYLWAIGVAIVFGLFGALLLRLGINNAWQLASFYLTPRDLVFEQVMATSTVGVAAVYHNDDSDDPVDIMQLSDDVVKLVFVGDIMLDRGVRRSVDRHGAGDYGYLFHRVPFVGEADIAFANLEGPVSADGVDQQNLYSFRMDPKVAPALALAGFDILSIANNHMADWGKGAFVDTLDILFKAGLQYVGGGINKTEAEAVKIVEKNGVKFGFVGFSDVGPNHLAATPEASGIVIADENTVANVVSRAASTSDVVIASFHFGNEYQDLPSDRQKKLARLAIDSGARIVVGHHPHVIQPVEFYKDGVIAYSLGNFIFDQYFSEATMTGGVLWVDMASRDILRVATGTVKLSPTFVPELQP